MRERKKLTPLLPPLQRVAALPRVPLPEAQLEPVEPPRQEQPLLQALLALQLAPPQAAQEVPLQLEALHPPPQAAAQLQLPAPAPAQLPRPAVTMVAGATMAGLCIRGRKAVATTLIPTTTKLMLTDPIAIVEGHHLVLMHFFLEQLLANAPKILL